ncbi:MAG: sigma-70 family RNA polymerase sigma factor [Bacteroides sp.]
MNNNLNLTDEVLIALYLNGENEAFDVLLNRHRDWLYSYILYTVRNVMLSEDLFQETCMKVIIMLREGRYNEEGKFSAWLRRIAHNLIMDFYRIEQQEKLVLCDEPALSFSNANQLADGVAESMPASQQVLEEVLCMMETLPEKQREVIRLRFYQDLSFKEIAAQTGVSINTSLGRMRYAILNLRRMSERIEQN